MRPLLPRAGYNNKAPLIDVESAADAAALCANFCSFVFDYVARKKIQGTNANWYIIEQLPVISRSDYVKKFGEMTASEIIEREVLQGLAAGIS